MTTGNLKSLRHYGALALASLQFLAAVRAADSATGNEARFLSKPRQLIYEGRRSGEGYFSPDGRALIFQSEREPGNPF